MRAKVREEKGLTALQTRMWETASVGEGRIKEATHGRTGGLI